MRERLIEHGVITVDDAVMTAYLDGSFVPLRGLKPPSQIKSNALRNSSAKSPLLGRCITILFLEWERLADFYELRHLTNRGPRRAS